MLEELYKINWRALNTTYGNGEKVPALIEKLAFGEVGEAWELEMENFVEMLVHQGTTWRATTAAIPFLLEILPQVSIIRQVVVINFLSLFSSSWDSLDPQDKGDNWNSVTEVVKGYDHYLTLLSSSDAYVREYAIRILSDYKMFTDTQSIEIAQRLLDRFDQETDLRCALTLVRNMYRLMGKYPDTAVLIKEAYLTHLERIVEENKPYISQLAAIYVMKQLGDAVTSEVTQKVIATVKEQFPTATPEETKSFRGFGWSVYAALSALEQLSTPNYIEAMRSVLTFLATQPFYLWKFPIIYFLDHIFDEYHKKVQGSQYTERNAGIVYEFPVSPVWRTIANLTEYQKQALRVILSIDGFWKEKHNLLKMYGIQESASELREILK